MYLSRKISHSISEVMYENGTISKRDIAIYEYCYDYLLEQIIYTSTMLLISLPLHCFFNTLLYTCMFSFFRGYSGGYHAGNERTCAIISSLMFAFVLLVLPKLPTLHFDVSLPLYIFSTVCTLILTPIENRNKEFKKFERARARIACLLGTITATILFIIFSVKKLDLYRNTMVFCSIVIACSMIAGKISWYRYIQERKDSHASKNSNM